MRDAMRESLTLQRSITATMREQSRELILRLAASGLPASVIARRALCSSKTVATVCSAAGTELKRKVDYSEPMPVSRPGFERAPSYIERSEAGQQ